MSSIERAMNKLAGDNSDEPAVTVSTETPVPDVAPPPAAETPAPGAKREAAAKPPLERKAAPARPRSGEIHTKNFVNLDLERLSAAAFLTPDQAMSRQSEEFQHIKRRLLGNMLNGTMNNRPANLILITSSVPSEGKTFVSTNLAISIAMEMDHTVLAVDTDIMKRDLTRVFGLVGRPGLFDLLSEPDWKMEDLLVRTSIPNLVVLPSGNFREGSTELLASMRMRELSNEISGRYSDRVVIFDSPPVLATTTATALAPLSGQIILVAEAGNTKHDTLREAIQILDAGRITGIILNKCKQPAVAAYDYYGSYYRAKN